MDLFTYQLILEYSMHGRRVGGAGLILTCKWLYHNLVIKVLPHPASGWKQAQLESYTLRNVEEVRLGDNCEVTSLSHFANLRSLILYYFPLPQFEMSKLDLEELMVCGDRAFTDISHMRKLRKLYLEGMRFLEGDRGDQKLVENLTGLQKLTLYSSDVSDLNNLRNLKSLEVYWAPYLGKGSMKELDLEELSVCMEGEMVDIGHMANLRKLSSRHGESISQDCLDRLNLEILELPFDSPGCKIDHMTNLRELRVSREFTQESIAKLNLRKICVSYCPGIRDLNHMSELEELLASGDCGVTDDGIRNVNLRSLDCDYNPGITTVGHFTRLTRLSARGSSGITDEGLRGANLRWLDVSGNKKVTEYGCSEVCV